MLKGEKVILRPMSRAYLEKYWEYRNDVELSLFSSEDPPMPMEMERLERQFDEHLARPRGEFLWFGIEVQGGKFIGQCILHRFDHAARNCELGLTIGDRDYQNRGFGKDVVRLLTKYAFRLLNMEKVYLTTNGTNVRAQKSFAACGYVEEARLRRHIWLDGRFDDLVYMAAYREDVTLPSTGPDDGEPETVEEEHPPESEG